jgi:hypothetical protein
MRTAMLIGQKSNGGPWNSLGPLNDRSDKARERYRQMLHDAGRFEGVFYPAIKYCADGARWQNRKFKTPDNVIASEKVVVPSANQKDKKKSAKK